MNGLWLYFRHGDPALNESAAHAQRVIARKGSSAVCANAG